MSYPSKTEFDNLRNSLPLTYQTRGNYAFRTDLASNINTALRNVNTALAAYAKKTDIPVVPANVATKTDLAGYALASDLSKYQPAGRYVSPSELEAYQAKGEYALAKDLVSYAKSSDLANFQPKGEYALAADLASYAKSSDLANFQPKGEYALAANLASYAKSSDLANFQPKGEYALAADLASYAKESSLASYQPKGDYAVKSDLGNFQPKGDYALAKDLDSYAKQSSLAFYQPKGNYQPKGDYQTAGSYALQSELAGYQLKGNYQTAGNYAFKTELASYALTKDLANLQPKGNYALQPTTGNYALQSELAGYQLKGNYQTAGSYALQPTAGNYALQSELAGYAKTAGASTFSGQATFEKNAIVKTEGTTPFQVLGTGGLRVSGGNLSVSGALATFENNATVTTSAGKPFEVKGAGGIDVDSIGIAAAGTITGKGRLHITGTELLYVLNKNGLMIGKDWGGNGNLDVQGDTTIRGNASIAGSLSGNSLFLESGLDPALRLGPAIKDIGNARLNVQDKTGSYMRFFSGATETGSITQDSGTSLNVNKVNAGQVSTGNAFITNATIGNFNMTGAPTFGALATFKKNATVETTTDKPFQVTGAGGLQVDHTKLKLGGATFVAGTDDWVRMTDNAGVFDYGLAGKNLYADGAVEISTGGNEAQIKTPDGKTTINQSGIQFGGKNKTGYDENSAQISAGVHVPDSLNIVGMSDANKLNRKVDVWAEGGLTVYGEKLKVGGATFHSHPTDTWVKMSTDNGTTYNYGLAAKNLLASNDLSVNGNAFVKGTLEANSVGINPTDSFIYGNNTLGHYGLKWANETGNKDGPTAFLSSYGGIKMFTQGGERVAIDGNGTTFKGGLSATTGSISNLTAGNATITNLTVGNFNLTGAPTFGALATFKSNAIVETIADIPFKVTGPGGLRVTGGNLTVSGDTSIDGNTTFKGGLSAPTGSISNLSSGNASITNLTIGNFNITGAPTFGALATFEKNAIVKTLASSPFQVTGPGGLRVTGGNLTVSGDTSIDGNSNVGNQHVRGIFPAPATSSQGLHFQWNRSGNDGESWIINNQGGGGADSGIRFGKSNAQNVVTEFGRFNNSGAFSVEGSSTFKGASTFKAQATFENNATVTTTANNPFQVAGAGGLKVDHTKLKLGNATFVTGTDDWVRMTDNAGVFDYGLAGKNLYADGAVEISTGGNEDQIRNPDGKTTINQSGIQFGGKNKAGYETNSAQISAGVHVADSLNIVGMSDANKLNRKVDVWAEGGFTIYGEKLKVGGATFHSHPTDTWVRMSADNGTSYNYGLAAKNFWTNGDLSVGGTANIATANISGNASIAGSLSANHVFLESGGDPSLRLGPNIKDIGNARLNVQDKAGTYMRFFRGATETGSITTDGTDSTILNVNTVNAKSANINGSLDLNFKGVSGGLNLTNSEIGSGGVYMANNNGHYTTDANGGDMIIRNNKGTMRFVHGGGGSAMTIDSNNKVNFPNGLKIGNWEIKEEASGNLLFYKNSNGGWIQDGTGKQARMNF